MSLRKNAYSERMNDLKLEDYEVYQYIASYIETRGYSPLRSEIADALRIDMTTVKWCLQNLWNDGYLCYPSHITGKIYLTSKEANFAPIAKKEIPDVVRGDESRTKIYHYISAYIQEEQRSPALREIADALDLGTTTVKYHVDRLKEAGYLNVLPGKSRTLRLAEHQHAS